MNLRPPQALALRALRDMITELPCGLAEATTEQLRSYMAKGGRWEHTVHPNFTFALATGVGKTRLAGAIMAFLFLAKQSRNFLILAPRRAVLRRIEDALSPTFREYIFIDQNLVPEPRVVTGDQISGPAGVEAQQDVFRGGPTIYLLSPQLVSTSDRFSDVQEFAGLSPAQHLKEMKDLVVICDEAHHVGRIGGKETAAWTQAIRDLAPRLQLGLTATPRREAGENILYEYPLSQALIERQFTKDVHLLVRDFDKSQLSLDDIDRATIDYALRRLRAKQRAVGASSHPVLQKQKPVCVFFARDIEHAEAVASRIIEAHRFGPSEVLLTHSKASKSEEEIERLLSIEHPDNPVKVVVNVQELAEGWDVRNVYVVAPLRAMATFQGALQAMGRGLRLPAGVRVDDAELDALDVVCFGKQSLKQIVSDATTWLGHEPSGAAGIHIDDFEDDRRVTAEVCVALSGRASSQAYADLEPVHEEVSLQVPTEALHDLARMVVEGVDLSRARAATFGVRESITLERERFVRAAVARTIQGAAIYLSDDRHGDEVRQVVEAWLDKADPTRSSTVEFDPMEVGEEIARLICDGARRRVLRYQDTGRKLEFIPEPFATSVLVSVSNGEAPPPRTIDDLPLATEATFTPGACYRGLDGRLWERSSHAACEFDSYPEILAADLLDRSSEVAWWARNQPRRLRLNTPAGVYSPDFIIKLKDGVTFLLEVKGSIYWDPPDSEARTKARSANRWVETQDMAGAGAWAFGVALEDDVRAAGSWESLRPRLRTG